MDQLIRKSPSERSSEESVALSAGRVQRLQDEVNLRVATILEKSADQLSHQDTEDLLAAAGAPHSYRGAQLLLASYPHSYGPDLLYQVSRRYRHHPEVVKLAEELLSSSKVRERASRPLSIIIESYKELSCEEAQALLEWTMVDGDSRAVRHLARFAKRDGCGAHRQKACYPCLRGKKLVVDALRAAQDRPYRFTSGI